MYYFEQLLYEAAPSIPQSPIPVPKPVTYAPPGTKQKVAQQQAVQAQAQAQAEQQAQAHQQLDMQAKQAEVSQKQAQSGQPQSSPAQDEFDSIDFSDEDMGEDGEGDISQDPNTSLVPIKRYYLIQKLFALNDKLNQLRIKNDVLSLVILFIDSFSYESLLSLSNKLVEDIYLQVKETSKEAT